MYIDDSLVSYEESLVFRLRALYRENGFKRFKMSKFEAYDLYAANMDFLVSDHVISFTDTNGKLMALKPDVTLSLVRNSRLNPGELSRICYDENVYRVSSHTGAFKEIMQVGAECLGAVDDQCVIDTLLLAARSLACASDEYMLVVTDLDIALGLIASWGLSKAQERNLFQLISSKNLHGLSRLCRECGVSDEEVERLAALLSFSGSNDELCELLEQGPYPQEPLGIIRSILSAFEASGLQDAIRFDFSVMSDPSYYNGIVFQGFVAGAPAAVLSGGQYDQLMGRLGKPGRAVGFAVYVDGLGRR